MMRALISEYINLFGARRFLPLRALLCYYRTPKFRVVVLIRCLLKSKSPLTKRQYRNKLAVKYGVEIGTHPVIGSNLRIEHFQGVVIGDHVTIGNNCVLYQQVTLGQKDGKYPAVGNNVIIYAGAKVLGDITIGDHAVIGANAVVIKDVPANQCAAGVPARIINKGQSYS